MKTKDITGKLKAILLTLAIAASILVPQIITQPTQMFAAEPIYVTVDGEEVSFETPPQIINDRIMVQIRAIVEKLGCNVEWDNNTQTIYINEPGVPLQRNAIKTNDINVYVNNQAIGFSDQKPVNYEGFILIPSRAIVEELGCSIVWVADAQTQVITSPGKTAIMPSPRPKPTATPVPVATMKPVQTPVPTIAAQNVSQTVYITKTGDKYHADGCRYLVKSKIAITLTQAKTRGYSPCSVCNPPR